MLKKYILTTLLIFFISCKSEQTLEKTDVFMIRDLVFLPNDFNFLKYDHQNHNIYQSIKDQHSQIEVSENNQTHRISYKNNESTLSYYKYINKDTHPSNEYNTVSGSANKDLQYFYKKIPHSSYFFFSIYDQTNTLNHNYYFIRYNKKKDIFEYQHLPNIFTLFTSVIMEKNTLIIEQRNFNTVEIHDYPLLKTLFEKIYQESDNNPDYQNIRINENNEQIYTNQNSIVLLDKLSNRNMDIKTMYTYDVNKHIELRKKESIITFRNWANFGKDHFLLANILRKYLDVYTEDPNTKYYSLETNLKDFEINNIVKEFLDQKRKNVQQENQNIRVNFTKVKNLLQMTNEAEINLVYDYLKKDPEYVKELELFLIQDHLLSPRLLLNMGLWTQTDEEAAFLQDNSDISIKNQTLNQNLLYPGFRYNNHAYNVKEFQFNKQYLTVKSPLLASFNKESFYETTLSYNTGSSREYIKTTIDHFWDRLGYGSVLRYNILYKIPHSPFFLFKIHSSGGGSGGSAQLNAIRYDEKNDKLINQFLSGTYKKTNGDVNSYFLDNTLYNYTQVHYMDYLPQFLQDLKKELEEEHNIKLTIPSIFTNQSSSFHIQEFSVNQNSITEKKNYFISDFDFLQETHDPLNKDVDLFLKILKKYSTQFTNSTLINTIKNDLKIIEKTYSNNHKHNFDTLTFYHLDFKESDKIQIKEDFNKEYKKS